MLPVELRLRRPEDFERLRREGKTYAGKMMVLSVAPNELSQNRYGFVVTRKFGGAVARNRARRVMRSSIQELHLRLVSGYDLAIIVRHGLNGKGVPDVLQELSRLLHQAGLVVG